MHSGSTTKFHLLDFNWCYGETKWMAHSWGHRGLIKRGASRSIKYYKHKYTTTERQRNHRKIRELNAYFHSRLSLRELWGNE